MRPQGHGIQQPKASKCIRLIRADPSNKRHLDCCNTGLADQLGISLDFTQPLNLTVFTVFQYHQVEESLNDMDFQLFLDLYFTDGDYT